MVSLKYTFGLAIMRCLLTAASPHDPRGDIVTFDVPPGHGWNGTLVVDMPKATEYLEQEVGLHLDTFRAYLGRFPSPPPRGEYKLPEGSGSE